MQSHEYRILPAPRRAPRVRGARTAEQRFARALEEIINAQAREGWEYLRADTLPCEQRQGWFSGRVTVNQTLLVFRRALAERQGAGAPAPAVQAAGPRSAAMPASGSASSAAPLAAPTAMPPRPAAGRPVAAAPLWLSEPVARPSADAVSSPAPSAAPSPLAQDPRHAAE
ncbi:hypothetical protein ruthe_00844 [Rubellimicrobium thermophilum DSM 16684]|uniref:DUF4177 domain-containing protein n=1 Tax=Rubellimicrobium thermophilum DSM 16684 TaxID=1123069 RepID=S9R5C6_9RHOB|nr:hypothetical protein [Rubellimicrobium thermophilum]EPX87173.1 hypothetical protein ruthe_00844 [Rubellimicrobium thermophilum DSM 16684]